MLRHFNPKYPFPTVATTDRHYDPNNHTFDRLSRGGKWIHHDAQLHDNGLVGKIRALRRSGDDDRLADDFTYMARKVRRATQYVLNINGAHEFFNPNTGEGQRSRVGKHFAWSRRGHLMLPESCYEI
jgi:hypothetical protein